MKASLKLRDDQKPLLRAKIPVGILGFPFLSGITGGEPSDLSFNLQTAWIPGLALKFSYKPNDSFNPFIFSVKSGIGRSDSAIMSMSAEFSLLKRGNPCFMFQLRPQFGDFSAKKSVSSYYPQSVATALSGKVGGGGDVDGQKDKGGFQTFDTGLGDIQTENLLRLKDSPAYTAAASGIGEFFSNMAFMAKTKFPVRANAVLNVRWGVTLPADAETINGRFRRGFNVHGFPYLTVNKISIENVERPDKGKGSAMKNSEKDSLKSVPDSSKEMFQLMKGELEAMRRENCMVKEAIFELSSKMRSGNGGKMIGNEISDLDDKSKKKRGSVENVIRERKPFEFGGGSGSPSAADVSEELKKAIKGTSAK